LPDRNSLLENEPMRAELQANGALVLHMAPGDTLLVS
jgi:hypothetical protein